MAVSSIRIPRVCDQVKTQAIFFLKIKRAFHNFVPARSFQTPISHYWSAFVCAVLNLTLCTLSFLENLTDNTGTPANLITFWLDILLSSIQSIPRV